MAIWTRGEEKEEVKVMEKLTRRKQAVLDVLDEQIAELEEKLVKVQPLINELNSLKATRARLLDERSTTSGRGRSNGTQLSMETVIHDLRENGPSSPPDIARRVGFDATVVRSHLNRHKDLRYRQGDDGDWELIGTDGTEDTDEEE